MAPKELTANTKGTRYTKVLRKESNRHFTVMTVVSFPGTMRLTLAQPARAGEPYQGRCVFENGVPVIFIVAAVVAAAVAHQVGSHWY